MAESATRPGRTLRRPLRRGLFTLIAVAIAALAIVVSSRLGTLFPGGVAAASTSPLPSLVGPPSNEPAMTVAPPTPTPAPTIAPTPTPVPLVPAPLTGRLVFPEIALRHPIAVMVDDHPDARPQAGFNAASVVWHAPAEGGLPRYMLVFQERIPGEVGPVRSARQYYIEWAAETKAMYVHHGGSPQALETLRNRGSGSWVYNADGFRWEGRYVFRVDDRFAPHNVMTDGKTLRKLAKRIGADDGEIKAPWRFGPDAPRAERPEGGTIRVVYPYETITYRYDPIGNRYVRYIDDAKKPQVDVADHQVVAPANVVILRMAFGPLNDGHPRKQRLEAHNIGTGEAFIASNGVTIKGTWKKTSATAPTRLYGPDGKQITLTVGQTFIQVLALTYPFDIDDEPLPTPGASAAPSPSP